MILAENSEQVGIKPKGVDVKVRIMHLGNCHKVPNEVQCGLREVLYKSAWGIRGTAYSCVGTGQCCGPTDIPVPPPSCPVQNLDNSPQWPWKNTGMSQGKRNFEERLEG